MPWELDYAILMYNQLAKSFFHFDKNDKVVLEVCLNTSSYMINWKESSIPKDIFIKKYKTLKRLLPDDFKYNEKIYDGDQLYGHLDFERESISEEVDFYVSLCPDTIFDEYTLAYMIEGAKQIPNKYFAITPQISKLWDNTWDPLVNPIYMDIPYVDWNKQNSFSILNEQKNSTKEVSLQPIQYSKYAGWIDLYSKSHYEELAPIWDEWKGKGGWDLYSMIISDTFKRHGGDFQQYVLEGKTIFRYTYCEDVNLYSYYKETIKLNPQTKQLNQINSFEEKIPYYAQQQINKIFKT
jgi:hypothetical protein